MNHDAGPAGSAVPDARIVRHAGIAASLTAKLDTLFAGVEPPTGVLVAKSADLLKVMVFSLKRGIRVPDTVSLIARDWDHLVDRSIAHYRFENEAYARRLSRLMSQLVSDGHLRPEPHLVFPRYVAGDTVKDLR